MIDRGYIYFMTNQKNSALYIGVTSNLKQRVYQHKNHIYNGFTDKYHCTKLIYYEVYTKITDAILREKQLKNWHRDWKFNLINQKNSEWKDLYEEI